MLRPLGIRWRKEAHVDRDDPAYAGQRDYGPLLLRLYDPIVIRHVSRIVWRCPPDVLLDRFRARVRPNHLDVGPGTGWFLDHSGLPGGSPITILDPNTNVLDHVSRRLARFSVTAVEADVLKPLPVDGPFDSAALHLVIHCLPGPVERKALAVSNVAATLAQDGILFGASVLGLHGAQTRLSRAVLRVFNAQGGFDNLDDTEETLGTMLASEFEHVVIEVVGSVALFAATGRRTAGA
jgi:SAM-dependent methyltransferase